MPRPPEPRRSLEPRSEPNGFASSNLETQLINHPDYQAVGVARPRSSRSSHPPIPRSSRRTAENGNGRKVITAPTETAPSPVVKVESRPPRPARPSRSEPAEVITVTMTDQEQAVYAEMGISPLVLHSEEVKNPRGAIVMVARPGQDPLPLPQKTARPISEGMAEDVPETADELPSL